MEGGGRAHCLLLDGWMEVAAAAGAVRLRQRDDEQLGEGRVAACIGVVKILHRRRNHGASTRSLPALRAAAHLRASGDLVGRARGCLAGVHALGAQDETAHRGGRQRRVERLAAGGGLEHAGHQRQRGGGHDGRQGVARRLERRVGEEVVAPAAAGGGGAPAPLAHEKREDAAHAAGGSRRKGARAAPQLTASWKRRRREMARPGGAARAASTRSASPGRRTATRAAWRTLGARRRSCAFVFLLLRCTAARVRCTRARRDAQSRARRGCYCVSPMHGVFGRRRAAAALHLTSGGARRGREMRRHGGAQRRAGAAGALLTSAVTVLGHAQRESERRLVPALNSLSSCAGVVI